MATYSKRIIAVAAWTEGYVLRNDEIVMRESFIHHARERLVKKSLKAANEWADAVIDHLRKGEIL
jgi:hypothetical protein